MRWRYTNIGSTRHTAERILSLAANLIFHQYNRGKISVVRCMYG